MRAVHETSLHPLARFSVALVISNNSQSGAATYAQEHGIPFCHVSSATHADDDERDAAMLDALRSEGIDLVVTAGYMKKIGLRTLTAYADRIINVHPALLPSFGGKGMWGRHVHEAVLAAGEHTSGATVHVVTADYDEGPIIDSLSVPVLADDTVDSLAARVLRAEHKLLPRVITELAGKLSGDTAADGSGSATGAGGVPGARSFGSIATLPHSPSDGVPSGNKLHGAGRTGEPRKRTGPPPD